MRTGQSPLAERQMHLKRSDLKEQWLRGHLCGRGVSGPPCGGLKEGLHVAGGHTPRWHVRMAVSGESWFLVPTGSLECPHAVAAGPLGPVTEGEQAGGSRGPRGSERVPPSPLSCSVHRKPVLSQGV